jgi:BMFP domain-containing protein YqiC
MEYIKQDWALKSLVSICIALMGWNLLQTIANKNDLNTQLANVKTEMAGLAQFVRSGKEERISWQSDNDKDHREFLSKLDLLLPRKEFEIRVASIEVRLLKMEVDLADIRVRLAVLENKVVRP